MWLSCFGKRIVPFALTLLAGAALAGVGGVLGSHPVVSRSSVPRLVPKYNTYECPQSSVNRRHHSTPLTITYEPNTHYTARAWKNNIYGVVSLRVTFGADGEIKSVVPVRRLPDGLTEEAERAAWQIKFVPATENGGPVAVTKEMDYVFSLNDRMAAGL